MDLTLGVVSNPVVRRSKAKARLLLILKSFDFTFFSLPTVTLDQASHVAFPSNVPTPSNV